MCLVYADEAEPWDPPPHARATALVLRFTRRRSCVSARRRQFTSIMHAAFDVTVAMSDRESSFHPQTEDLARIKRTRTHAAFLLTLPTPENLMRSAGAPAGN
ncbi:hypothetical protein FISHEDRAFT_70821 [Fistulina hepatica ATCC 64428]|uniref:Uncharacterized protein n=1 Tax=Fistulina hepatica ATCC 64428 TaxID=1128425 RepID=A0A0D7AJD6_9AGAR|nr:hypothetical protein FISHEDRAFT_70821 [Fistulina hepatica ATCC 64428]